MSFEPGAWVDVAAALALGDPDGDYWRLVSPGPDASSLMAELTSRVAAGTWEAQHVAAVRVTVACNPGTDWASFAEAIWARLQGGNSVPSREVTSLLEALWQIRARPVNSSDAATRLATEGHLMHHFHQAFADGDDAAMSWCLLLVLQSAQTFVQPPAIGNSIAGFGELTTLASQPSTRPSFAVAVSDLFSRERQLGVLFLLLDSGTATPLVVDIVRNVYRSGHSAELLNSSELINRWPFLRQQVFSDDDAGFAELIKSFVEQTDLVEQLRAGPFRAEDAPLLAAVLDGGGAASPEYVQWLIESLQTVTTPAWLTELQSDGPLLSLLAALEEHGSRFVGKSAYRDALLQFGDWLIAGNGFQPALIARRPVLLACVEPDERELLREELVDAASGRDKNPGAAFFGFFGTEVATSATVLRRPGVVRQLFLPLLVNRNAAGLEWLAGIIERTTSLFEASGEPVAVRDFIGRLPGAVKASPDSASEAIARISELVGVSLDAGDESASAASGTSEAK